MSDEQLLLKAAHDLVSLICSERGDTVSRLLQFGCYVDGVSVLVGQENHDKRDEAVQHSGIHP
jgi:hypothetical protein